MTTDYSCSECGRCLNVTEADGSSVTLQPCSWCLARAKDGYPVNPVVDDNDNQQPISHYVVIKKE